MIPNIIHDVYMWQRGSRVSCACFLPKLTVDVEWVGPVLYGRASGVVQDMLVAVRRGKGEVRAAR